MEVLSIVGEQGIHGMEYNFIISKALGEDRHWQSRRSRISIVAAPKFCDREFEDYLILAWRMGLVYRSGYSEYEAAHEINKSAYEIRSETVRLTPEGWVRLGKMQRPILERWLINLRDNLPTVVFSIASAVLSAWAIFVWGPQ